MSFEIQHSRQSQGAVNVSDILTEERALQNAKVTRFCFKKQLPPPQKN